MPLISEHRGFKSRGASAPLFRGLFSDRRLPYLLILLALLPFYPGLFGGFVFDDFPNIVDNPAFHAARNTFSDWWEAAFSSASSDLARPLGTFTLLLNAHFGGLDPFYFKLTNLGLHGVNALILLGLLRSLLDTPEIAVSIRSRGLKPRVVALWTSVAWTLLAIHVSPMFLVVQRMEMLSHSFVLLALLIYVRARQQQVAGVRDGRLAIVSALLLVPAIGVLAKESAALTPIYALALEVFVFRFAAARKSNVRLLIALFAVIGVVGTCMSALVLPRSVPAENWINRDFNLGERLLTEARVLWEYARWIVLPDLREMSLYHDAYVVSRSLWQPWTTVIAIGAWLAVIGLMLHLAKRRSLLGLGIAWFLGAHLLTATILPLELVFEHRNYFAAVGVLLALLAAVLRWMDKPMVRRWAPVAVALLLLAQASVTAVRSYEWGDPLRLALAEASRKPESPRANYELGKELLVRSGGDPQSRYFGPALETLERAAQLPRASILPIQALLIASSTGSVDVPDRWWTAIQHTIEHGPWVPATLDGLHRLVICQIEGRCHFDRRQLEMTLASAVKREPRSADILVIQALYAQLHLGDAVQSEALLRHAVQLDVNNPVRWYQWGQALALVGRLDEALTAADRIDALDRWKRHGSKADSLRRLVSGLEARDAQRGNSDAPSPPGT